VLTGRNIGLTYGPLYGKIRTSQGKPWLSSIAILQMQTYKTILFQFGGEKRVLDRGLTLEEVEEICNSDNSSSRTCDTRTMAKYGEGPWFIGRERE